MTNIEGTLGQLHSIGWDWTRIGAHYKVSEREARRWFLDPDVEAPRPEQVTQPPKVLDYAPVFVVNDTQYPHHDPALWEVACQIAADAEVEEIIWAGDMVDFEQLSSFKFDAHKTAKAKDDVWGFHRDLRHPLLESVKRATGAQPKEVWLDGNHEHRYQRYCESHSALEDADPVKFLELHEVSAYYPYGTRIGHFLTPSLAVVHGWSTAKAAVRTHVEEMGCSVIHGHTHRVSSWRKRTSRECLVGHELGHMSDFRKVPGFHGKGAPDWQQVAGTIVHRARRGESFNIDVLEVFGDKDDRVMANDRVYHIERR